MLIRLLDDLFVNRHPRQIKLPCDLRIGFNVWGQRRFWITLSGEQWSHSCDRCGAKAVTGAKVYAKLPFSRRYKEEIYG